MAKKFFSLLGVFALVLLTGICFVGCQKAVSVQGTISISYDGFTTDDFGGDFYIICNSSVSVNNNSTATGATFTYGPEKTKSKENITVEISLTRKWDINLTVREVNNKPFTTKIKDEQPDGNYRAFVITIPFAEKVDYSFTLSKPNPQINEIELGIENTVDLNTSDQVMRDFLDHIQVWVDNKEQGVGGQPVGGFMPLVGSQDEDRWFGLAGKFINVDMTEESFTLCIKYVNEDRDLPFNKASLLRVFTVENSIAQSVSLTELQGQRVYALEFSTQNVNESSILQLSQDGLSNLIYISSAVHDDGTGTVYLSDGDATTDNIVFKFERVGWKTQDSQEWQEGSLPQKTYGQKLILKYRLAGIECASSQTDTLEQIVDFAGIKFSVNGVPVKNIQYDESGKTYTFEIGEYDTPDTYFSGVEMNSFDIDVDRQSIKVLDNVPGMKNVTFSNQFKFYRGDDNIVLTYIIGDDGKTNAKVYTGGAQEVRPFEFTLNDLGRFESFTIKITVNGQTYTKTFVKGVDFLVASTGEDALVDAYFLGFQGTQGDEGTIADGLITYSLYINGGSNQLIVKVNAGQAGDSMQVLLEDVQLRNIDVEAHGGIFDANSQPEILDSTRYDGTYETDKIEVDFDLNEMYDEANCNIQIDIYSNDVLLYTFSGQGESTSNLSGYEMFDASFIWNVHGYSSEPDIQLQFNSNGVLAIRKGDVEMQVLITKIVVTFS